MEGRPLDVLEAALEGEVVVLLKDGEIYRGRLTGYDQHMNVVLAPLEPAADDAAADGAETDATSVEDTTVIRGDNVVTIEP